MEATRFMGSRDESSVQGPPLMEENDEVDRLTISASMWMAARLQLICSLGMGFETLGVGAEQNGCEQMSTA
eukprot:scaffold288230_cov26-Tisochrysis_lutea.AAC.1